MPDLGCPCCGYTGRIDNGMYHLHRTDESWQKCLVEKRGWIEASMERGNYVENEDHFFMPDGRPHLSAFYRESKAHLDRFISLENLNGRTCLDLGASIGWVEAYLMRFYPGAALIALDVNDDPLCGLGRSEALKRRRAVDFQSVVADMHHIPLVDQSVDVVFTVDALHHFRDLRTVFNEVRRVLRPGGVFYGLNEPDRPEGTDELEYVRKHIDVELRHQIIERRPTIRDYLEFGSCLHLRIANGPGLVQHVHTASLFLSGGA